MNAAEEVVGAVDRVDHPGQLALASQSALFAEKPVLGKTARQRSDDQLLAGVVGLADVILQPLFLDRERGATPIEVCGEGAGVADDRLGKARAFGQLRHRNGSLILRWRCNCHSINMPQKTAG
jgi:hypothetical protein